MVGRIALSAVLLLPGAAQVAAAERANVRLRYESTRRAVNRVLDSVQARLAQPACAALLDEFRAVDGRRLSERLAEVGVASSAYVDRVLFYDGELEQACNRRDVLAVTIPGARVVKVCPGFYQRWSREPAYAEATLIHEVLHTLGLGENPPSSREITHRVMEGCMKGEPSAQPPLVADRANP
jgi:hypothetical protein